MIVNDTGEIHNMSEKIFSSTVLKKKKNLSQQLNFTTNIKKSNDMQLEKKIENDPSIINKDNSVSFASLQNKELHRKRSQCPSTVTSQVSLQVSQIKANNPTQTVPCNISQQCASMPNHSYQMATGENYTNAYRSLEETVPSYNISSERDLKSQHRCGRSFDESYTSEYSSLQKMSLGQESDEVSRYNHSNLYDQYENSQITLAQQELSTGKFNDDYNFQPLYEAENIDPRLQIQSQNNSVAQNFQSSPSILEFTAVKKHNYNVKLNHQGVKVQEVQSLPKNAEYLQEHTRSNNDYNNRTIQAESFINNNNESSSNSAKTTAFDTAKQSDCESTSTTDARSSILDEENLQNSANILKELVPGNGKYYLGCVPLNIRNVREFRLSLFNI